MMPNDFGPAGAGDADFDGDDMPGTYSNTDYGNWRGYPGNFQPNYMGGMGFQGGFQPGYTQGPGFWGNFSPGFGPGMGFQGNFPPGGGMPFQGTFVPGMGYPGAFQPGFNAAPGMGPGFGPGIGPSFAEGVTVGEMMNPTQLTPGPMQMGWGLGGMRRWGGTYSPQFMMTGLPTDDEIVEMVYDAIDNDPLIPYDADINVDADAGTVTLTGTVMSKQIKHAAGDDAWWIPGVDDVCNELNVERRHPAHAAREQGMESRRITRGTTEMTSGAENQPLGTAQTPRAARRGGTRR